MSPKRRKNQHKQDRFALKAVNCTYERTPIKETPPKQSTPPTKDQIIAQLQSEVQELRATIKYYRKTC